MLVRPLQITPDILRINSQIFTSDPVIITELYSHETLLLYIEYK